jgi:hypothetical protein
MGLPFHLVSELASQSGGVRIVVARDEFKGGAPPGFR